MGLNGETLLKSISESLGVSLSTLRRWFATFRQDGLEAVLNRGYGIGRPSLLDEQIKAYLLYGMIVILDLECCC